MTAFDYMVVEALAEPELRVFANDLIDIVTARTRKEVTDIEAEFLVWNIEETRAPSQIKDDQLLAQIKALCAAARARIGAQNEPRTEPSTH